MSLLTLGIWVVATVAFIVAGIALLPDGNDYPLPPEFATAIETLYTWLYSFNNLFPVDTLVQVLLYGVLLLIVTRILWPMIFFIIRLVTAGLK